MNNNITFMKLHDMIEQTRKARKGKKGATDYFSEVGSMEYESIEIYHKALRGANQIVKYCFENGIDKPFKIIFGKEEKKAKSDNDKKYLEAEKKCKELAKQNSELAEQLIQLESKLARYRQGGRKDDKEKEVAIVTYKTNSPDATVREIAAALKVSTRTVQKVLVKHGLNGRNYNVSRK